MTNIDYRSLLTSPLCTTIEIYLSPFDGANAVRFSRINLRTSDSMDGIAAYRCSAFDISHEGERWKAARGGEREMPK